MSSKVALWAVLFAVNLLFMFTLGGFLSVIGTFVSFVMLVVELNVMDKNSHKDTPNDKE